MCGRYTLHANQQTLAEAIAAAIPEDYTPSYNISPGSDILTVTATAADRMQWGLRTPQNFHINARLETADSTPRFRESWEENRCLIPANGFYEWLNDGIRKQPYYIYPPTDELLFFAGLWVPSTHPEQSAQCVILTTAAQETVRKVHDRMPVILPRSLHFDWLRHALPKDEANAFAQKVYLEKHSVSTRVNSVQNNDSKLVVATTPQTDDQMQLF